MWILAYKLVRPILPISSGIATWIIAQFCGAPVEQSIAAAVTMALNTIGASFYHYGGANWMYARKSERFKFKDPEIIRLLGLLIFSLSIAIAVLWLPKICVLICLFNTFAIAAYSAKLSSHWTTKNITMSIVCITPIALGWQAGTISHPIVGWGIAMAASAYFAREVVKDVKDILANEGNRVTLPMVLGINHALQLAGILLFISVIPIIKLLQFAESPFQITMAGTAVLLLITTGSILLIKKKAWRSETLIQGAICLMLLALW